MTTHTKENTTMTTPTCTMPTTATRYTAPARPRVRTTTINSHYIVQTSAAKMPSSCWGRYRNVAVLEVDADLEYVSAISERARGCRAIAWYRGKLHSGSTRRSADGRAMAQASAHAARRNAELAEEHVRCTQACAYAGRVERAARLLAYDTAEDIREATVEERDASREAATHDGGAGVIRADGRRCYVQE